MNKKVSRYYRLVNVILILSFISIIVSGCTRNNDIGNGVDEDEYLETGKIKVEEWLEANCPDAALESCEVITDISVISDAVIGTYSTNEQTVKYVYDIGTDTMYVDTLLTKAGDITAQMFGDGLGLNSYEIGEDQNVSFAVHCTFIEKSGDEREGYISEPVLPYTVSEKEMNNYLEDIYQNTEKGNCGTITLISKNEIKIDSLNLNYIKEHPNHNIMIYSKDQLQRIYITTDKDSYNGKYKDGQFINITKETAVVETDKQGNEYTRFDVESYYSYDIETLKLVEHN